MTHSLDGIVIYINTFVVNGGCVSLASRYKKGGREGGREGASK